MENWKKQFELEIMELWNNGWNQDDIGEKYGVSGSIIYGMICKILGNTSHTVFRKQAIDILGSVCISCGFSDPRALQIDHINGGGSEERRKMGSRQLYTWIIKNPHDAKKKYQILCANCNWIKKFERKEVGKPYIRKPRKPKIL